MGRQYLNFTGDVGLQHHRYKSVATIPRGAGLAQMHSAENPLRLA